MLNNISIVPVILFLGFVVAIVCMITLKPEKYNSKIIKASNLNTNNIKYKDNVYIVYGNNFSVSEDEIIFNGVDKSFRKNMVILGEQSPGFMRRIINIIYKDNNTIIKTEKVDLDEVLDSIVFEKNFLYKDIITDNKKESFQYENTIQTSFSQNLAKTFYFDRFGNQVDTSQRSVGSGYVGAYLEFRPNIYVKLLMNNATVNKFILKITASFLANINQNLRSPMRISKTFEKTVYPVTEYQEQISTWTIPIATGIWITIKPELVASITINMLANVDMENSIELKTKTPCSIGVDYSKIGSSPASISFIRDSGTWIRNITNTRNNIQYNNDFIGVDAAMILGLDCLLWGFVGPFFEVKPFLRYTREFTLNDCPRTNSRISTDLCPYFEHKVGPGITITIGGKLFKLSIDEDIYDNFWPLWTNLTPA